MAEEEEIREWIRQAAANGKVPCKVLLELAERTKTPPREIGRICDEMKIRVSTCQLGCFA
ncbi:MAG TPA: hypothetical protein VMZ50_03530 [Phycisphaerae bacterium]|nr:hypothetical protein [Phycisphaerae bacterium]